MAGKPSPADVLPADFAGMTKSQLYDIMSQMKTLIEQNRQQAREILIQNPPLTKALFQAQIMLGMVQPPPVIPAIQPTVSQQPPQPAPISPASNVPIPQPLQGQSAASQAHHQSRKPHPNQPISSSVPPADLPSQSIPIHTLPPAPKGHLNAQVTGAQTSQISSIPPQPHQPQSAPSGISHLPQQPPMPAQPRPPHSSMPGFHNQYQQSAGSNIGFQHGGGHQHPSQSMYHSGNRNQHPVPSYPQGQQPIPSQPPPQSLYQGGSSHLTSEFNQGGSSMQVDRGSSGWPPGPPDSSTMAQAPPANQPARSAPLTPDMEKALLQQVMSLTPEQINLLPQEQRNQVLQLQQMLRQ
ncbi:Cleavage stimulating factor 64 [Linum perenne]